MAYRAFILSRRRSRAASRAIAGERGAGRVAVLIAIAVIAVIGFFVFRTYSGSRAKPPATEGSPSAAAAPQSPAPAAAPAAEPPPQTPTVATDPAYKEERGRKIASLQDIPDYPGATVVGSAEQARAGEPAEGYRAQWTTTDSVSVVMAWYRKKLPGMGWTYKPSEDAASSAEPIDYIKKGHLDGYVSAESDGKQTEITVSLQDVRRAARKGQR